MLWSFNCHPLKGYRIDKIFHLEKIFSPVNVLSCVYDYIEPMATLTMWAKIIPQNMLFWLYGMNWLQHWLGMFVMKVTYNWQWDVSM